MVNVDVPPDLKNESVQIQQKPERLRVSSPQRREVRPKEAAALIGCSIGYVYALMNDGLLEHRAIKRRGKERGIRLISRMSITRFLSQEKANGQDVL
jgi:hypothetical protein